MWVIMGQEIELLPGMCGILMWIVTINYLLSSLHAGSIWIVLIRDKLCQRGIGRNENNNFNPWKMCDDKSWF